MTIKEALMASQPMWKVTAETGGRLFDDFKEKSIVAIGWERLGDLKQYKKRQAIIDALSREPDYNHRKAITSGSQVYRFAYEMKPGDWVLTYNPSQRVYLIGRVIGDYEYDPNCIVLAGDDERWPNKRAVEWIGEVSRDALSVPAKNCLGAILTLFQVSKEATQEIEAVLKGKKVAIDDYEKSQETEEEDLLKDIQSRALEFTKDKISRLEWDEMQALIAGLLRAMGYKTRVSPAGPDKGKDIIASPDGFGFESPRIVVEVKHRSQTMGAPEIRSFIGGRHQEDKGLYVSTGGFTKEAYYEAERSNVPLTLMNIDDVVQAVLDHYEKMDIETQRLLPLKKLYWPA
jgi:restriction system protein